MWVVTDSLKTTGNTCAHFTIAALTGRGLQCDVDPYCASVHSWDKGVYTWLLKAHCTGTVCCLACEVQQCCCCCWCLVVCMLYGNSKRGFCDSRAIKFPIQISLMLVTQIRRVDKTQNCLVKKWLLCERCFIHQYTIDNGQYTFFHFNFSNVTLPLARFFALFAHCFLFKLSFPECYRLLF